MSTIALLTGPATHLDHLGVLSALWKIPLVVTCPQTLALAQAFYPPFSISYQDPNNLSLEQYDAIFSSGQLLSKELQPLLSLLHNKTPRFVYCPHGNSDKPTHTLPPQDICLLYGSHLHELMKSHGSLTPSSHIFFTGNYRYLFYLTHKKFFDALAYQHVFSQFSTSKPIAFCAPTWKKFQDPAPFFSQLHHLIDSLSPHYNVLLKLHPFLIEDYPCQSALLSDHPSALFLENFPPIYPLLAKADLLIGNFSSIDYDFLTFNRPLYFLSPPENPSPLSSCGLVLPPNNPLAFISQTLSTPFSLQRSSLYQKVFSVPAKTDLPGF